jgi:DNA-binding PadR family transcriptional regulator
MSRRESPEASRVDPQCFLPLTPAVFYILLVLAEGDGHGYAIMQKANRRSGGALRLGPGTLYAAIARLLEDGLIVELENRPAPELDDSRRRYYRLSDRGSLVLSAEAKRLAELARQARSTRAVRELKHA